MFGLDQVLNGRRLDDPRLTHKMDVAQWPGLNALIAGQRPALTVAGHQRYVLQRREGRRDAATAQQARHQNNAVALCVLLLGNRESAPSDIRDTDMFCHDATAIEDFF